MDQNALKQQAAKAALEYIEDDTIVGVGTGSTVNFFIEALATIKNRIEGAVSSSKATTDYLKKHQIPVIELNAAREIDVYIDGADESNHHKQLIKGGGGALTGEKIVAAIAKKFVCIIDESKLVDILGTFPLPIEVIPLARSFVAREIVKLGGDPVYREDYVTDYGNQILDVYNFKIMEAIKLEERLNQIPGVVTNGLFAKRGADVVLMATQEGVKTL